MPSSAESFQARSCLPAAANRPVFLCRGGEAGDVLARLGVMECRTFQRPASLAVVAIIAFLVLPLPSSAQVSCHPNVFGGQDCTSPEGRSSSTPNIFGGFDTTSPDGSRSSSHPNISGSSGRTRRNKHGFILIAAF